MKEKNFYLEFNSLPIEAQKQIIIFMKFIKDRYKNRKAVLNKKNSITKSKFIGIWKNRLEMQDSISFKKNLRKKEWRTEK